MKGRIMKGEYLQVHLPSDFVSQPSVPNLVVPTQSQIWCAAVLKVTGANHTLHARYLNIIQINSSKGNPVISKKSDRHPLFMAQVSQLNTTAFATIMTELRLVNLSPCHHTPCSS
jgi:hypothetical protein